VLRKFWWDLSLGVLSSVVVSVVGAAAGRWDIALHRADGSTGKLLAGIAFAAALAAAGFWVGTDFLPKPGESDDPAIRRAGYQLGVFFILCGLVPAAGLAFVFFLPAT
jgi:hypothetical protein